jgi:hypothetical protein
MPPPLSAPRRCSVGPPIESLAVSAPPASASARSLDFDAGGHLYATHALHPFCRRCPRPLVSVALERYMSPGDTVLDPVAGSGTTLVEATLLGRRAWGTEMDPGSERWWRASWTRSRARGREPLRLVMLDELNKYAPRQGRGPLKDRFVDRRARSLARGSAGRLPGGRLERRRAGRVGSRRSRSAAGSTR